MRISTNSTAIKFVDYNTTTGLLIVQFKNNDIIYHYIVKETYRPTVKFMLQSVTESGQSLGNAVNFIIRSNHVVLKRKVYNDPSLTKVTLR